MNSEGAILLCAAPAKVRDSSGLRKVNAGAGIYLYAPLCTPLFKHVQTPVFDRLLDFIPKQAILEPIRVF